MLRTKELRKQKKLSQTDLARHLKVGTTTVSNWERGDAHPDVKTLIRLSQYFEVSIDYLVGNPYATETSEQSLVLEDKELYGNRSRQYLEQRIEALEEAQDNLKQQLETLNKQLRK